MGRFPPRPVGPSTNHPRVGLRHRLAVSGYFDRGFAKSRRICVKMRAVVLFLLEGDLSRERSSTESAIIFLSAMRR